MKKVIKHFHMLMEIELQIVPSIKQDIIFLQSKKVEHKNAIWFLQEVYLSGYQIREKIERIKPQLRESIYAQAKQRLTNKQQA